MLLSLMFAALSPFLRNVVSPVEVAVQPTFAVRDMCRLDNGEIRHYGRRLVDGKLRTVYIASTDGFNWSTHLAEEGDPGAMLKIPWTGTWFALKGGFDAGKEVKSLRCYRSKTGPGDVHAEKEILLERGSYEPRQTVFLTDRRRIVCALSDIQTFKLRGNSCYHATVMYSDDDAKTWKMVDVPAIPDVARLAPGDKMPHWFNDGCEPSLVAMKDGSLRMMVRTSGPYAGFLESRDGGETWRVLPHDRRFWQANTMPLLARLSDGRILAVWNNTAMLPTRDPKGYPELAAGELSGEWETVFTNRDALHAAISDDEGVTWKGFRELILCGPRNNADFRQLGNAADQEHDKSVHQSQLLELEGGKVLLALGQNAAARRMIVFDPNWLLERERHDDFRNGFAGLSNHLYVRSMAGGARGWAGHCAFNRVPGALLVRDPETTRSTKRELLQLCRIRDPRLLSDRQGLAWNFPAAECGTVELDVRIAKSGFRLTLADHWMNPCDETGPSLSPFTCEITKGLIGADWCRLAVAFDGRSRTAKLSVDGRLVKELAYTGENPAPISYLHLQTLAEEEDTEGTYFRSFDMKASEDPSAAAAAADRPWRVFNEDNDHWFCAAKSNEVNEAGLRAYIDGIADSAKPTHMFLCACGQRASFDSKAWEPIWAGINDPDASGKTNYPWCVNAKRLHDQGVDAYRTWIDQCRRRGISPWISMRVNDDHIMVIPHYFRNETFWREHPELRKHPELDPWAPDASKDWSLYSYDYSHPEVRDHQFAMFKELVWRYDADGIEIDWLRTPGVFAPGKEKEGLPLITDFMRRCRREADLAAKARGRAYPIAVRLPVMESACRSYGFDPLTWAKERLADVFIFSDCGSTADFDVDTAWWREHLGKVHPGVRVLVGTDTSYACAPQSKFRALELRDLAVLRAWIARYADEPGGLYFFNSQYLPQSARNEMYVNSLFPDGVNRGLRRFPMSFHDAIGVGADKRRWWRLPYTVARPLELTVQAVPGPQDGQAEVVLGFDAVVPDAPVALNGVAAEGPSRELAETKPYSNLAKCVRAWRFPVSAVRKGANKVVIPSMPRVSAQTIWCEIALR